MIPASPHPLIVGGDADPLDEFGKIDRSVRLRRSAGANWSRAFAAGGSLTTWTLGLKAKRADITNTLRLFGIGNDTNAVSQHSASLINTGELQFFLGDGAGATVANVFTAAKWRDPDAHYDFWFVWDTTNATASERLRIYVDGVRQAASSSTYPAQNAAGQINGAVLHRLGALSGSTSAWFDGPLSQVIFIDGQALPPTIANLAHPRTGQWRPKTRAAIRSAVAAGGGARNGWGVNGCLLPFDDPTSLTTLGYDRSQSDTDTTGNNWTANNISLTAGATYDSHRDTATDNCATFDRLLVPQLNTAMSSGNLQVTASYTVYNAVGRATVPVSPTRVMQAEMKLSVFGSLAACGVIRGDEINWWLGSASTGVAYLATTGQKRIAGVNSAYGATWTTQTIGVVTDPAAQTVTFYKDGVPQGAISAPAIFDGKHFIQFCSDDLNNPTLYGNFGQRDYAFPVAGAGRCSTKNLPVSPPHIKSENAVVCRTGSTGANIQSAIASARLGWPAWIDIYRHRDATAEGWRLVFSDDPTYFLDTSTTNEKALLAGALAGASYGAMSLRVSPETGIATGAFDHVTATPSVINDGLSNARKMVILHRESAGGGAFYCYHPDLTSGKLIYLNTTAGETTDASISAVTASSFTAAAALPSGRYRYISIAETAGLSKMQKHSGNNSSDGPLLGSDFLPGFLYVKRINVGGDNHVVFDAARNSTNPVNNVLLLNLPDAELSNSTTNLADFTSVGAKLRGTGTNTNTTAASYVSLMFAAALFRYSNAH